MDYLLFTAINLALLLVVLVVDFINSTKKYFSDDNRISFYTLNLFPITIFITDNEFDRIMFVDLDEFKQFIISLLFILFLMLSYIGAFLILLLIAVVYVFEKLKPTELIKKYVNQYYDRLNNNK
jgi:hypothetical protein